MTNATQQQQQGLLGLATHPQNVLEEEEQLTEIVQQALEFVALYQQRLVEAQFPQTQPTSEILDIQAPTHLPVPELVLTK